MILLEPLVNSEIESQLWGIIKKLDVKYGKREVPIERIIFSKSEDLPLLLPLIPEGPAFYKKVCTYLFRLKLDHENLSPWEFLCLKDVSSIFYDLIHIDMKEHPAYDEYTEYESLEFHGVRLQMLADVCVLNQEYDLAEKCILAIITLSSKGDEPNLWHGENVKIIHTRLKCLYPKLPPLKRKALRT